MNSLIRLTWATLFCAAAVAQPAAIANADEGLRRAFAEAIYSIGNAGHGAWHGENRTQRLTLEFDSGGVHIIHPEGQVGFGLAGYGYGERLDKPAPARLRASANRLEYQRDDLTEWYVNGSQGLEQGFTFARRPGPGGSGPLEISLAITGDLELKPEKDGGILLSSGAGVVLRYSGLATRDARGRALPSRMEVRGREIRLVVDDEAAQYPVVIDPTWTQQAELTSSDGFSYDQFGISVAISGNTAVIGAPQHGDGAAYVFVLSGGTWSAQAELTATDAPGGFFGSAVAVSGDTAVIGAYEANGNQGSAFVFVRNGTTWTQQAELTATDGSGGDQFGYSVSVSGATAVIGAYEHQVGGNSYQGAAYVFVQDGATWNQQAELTASDGQFGDNFGISVAIDGGILAVGASGQYNSQGGAYTFVGSGASWSQQSELEASDGMENDYFGEAIAVSGTTVVVGAYNHRVAQYFSPGVAYVFAQNGGDWIQRAELMSSDGVDGDQFGYSVAVNGDTALIGAFAHPVGSNGEEGSAYVFVRNGSGEWAEQTELTGLDASNSDNFGYSVSLFGGTALAGAFQHQVGGNGEQGAAYVFSLPAQLSISAGSLNPFFLGGPGTITVTLTNQGSATVGTATISETIGAGFEVLSVSPGCSFSGPTVTCVLAPGYSAASTTLTAYVTTSLTATSPIVNTVTLTDSTDAVASGYDSDTIAIAGPAPLVDSSLTQLMLSGSTDNGTCAAGNRTLTATDVLQNVNGSTLTNPYAVVGTLSGGNTLLAQSSDSASIAPGADLTLTFHIQLASCNTFQLLFDVRSN